MELKYFVSFKPQAGVDAQFALRERLLNIEGTAIDSSVNANKWQVPPEDLNYLVQTLTGAQLRIDHTESAMAVIGKVPEAKLIADKGQVWFRAEVGDLPLIEKITRGYLDHVSIQLDSDDVECSKCLQQTRREGMLIHLCPGAWEIVHKPKVRELSIVASPAYKDTTFKPMGFAAAMNETQKCDIIICKDAGCALKGSFVCTSSRLLDSDKDVGSRRKSQEPENKKESFSEVKPLPETQNAQVSASPLQAQGVVNTNNGQGEKAPKQVNYDDFMQQLEGLQNQIASDDSAEADAMRTKIAVLQKQVQNRATKQQLSKKISDLQQQLQKQPDTEDSEETSEDADDACNENSSKKSEKAAGKGIIGSPDQRDPAIVGDATMGVFGNTDWFRDIAKASNKLKGLR